MRIGMMVGLRGIEDESYRDCIDSYQRKKDRFN